MDIILAFITSVLIYLSFKALEAKYTPFDFTILELIHGRFNLRNISLSIAIPFAITLVFGIIHTTIIPAAYTIPGFLAAILIVYPYFKNPESIPPEMQMERERAYIVYLFFVASFTLFSYLGGYVGSRGVPLLPSGQGIIDGFWIVLFGAMFTHFAHRFLNKKFPGNPIKKADVSLPGDDSKPLQA